MMSRSQGNAPDNGPDTSRELEELRARVREAEETLEAIRSGDVDAVVVGGPRGQQVYTLENADRPYRLLIEQMQEGAVMLASDGAVLYCNRGFAQMLGLSSDQVIGTPFERFIVPDEHLALRQLLAGGARTGGRGEFMLMMANGRAVPVHLSFSDLVHEGTHICCGVVTDLSQQRERWRALVEATPQLVWSCLADGRWDYLSPQWVAYTGVQEAKHHGYGWLDAVHPDDRERVRTEWAAAVANQSSYDGEYRLRRHDGVYRWFKARSEGFRGKSGKIVRWFGTCTDVDEHKQVEAELQRLNQELESRVEERTRELAAAAARRAAAEEALHQAQKMQALGQLTGGIAHDFNNLLMVIQTSVDFLRRGTLPPEKSMQYVEAIGEAAARAASLTHQLLAFARKQPLKPEIFNLNEHLRQIIEMLRRALGARYQIETDLAPDLWPVEADPNQLEIAALNIGVNARDAMPEGGTLRIVTRNVTLAAGGDRPAGEFVCFSFTDTGGGIPPDVLEHVFEPFFTTKDVGKGTGLGLSQVHGFAAQSGGEARIESTLGKGTTVIIHLPRARSERSAAVAEPPAPVHAVSGRTVLLVEDNPAVGDFARQLLLELGYATILVDSAAAALKVIQAGERVDIVFSDIIMPGMTGTELADELKRTNPGLPVVLTTGYSEDVARGDTIGIPVIIKPYRLDALAAVIARALSQNGTSRNGGKG